MTQNEEAIKIRMAEPSDAMAIAEIYNHYITASVITFEEEPVPSSEITRRLGEVRSASLPWLIAEEGPQLTGYAYATPWKSRTAYRFSAEITVYIHPGFTGRGIGSLLYGQLIPMLQVQGIHAVLGGIALPNQASVALHEKFGFQKVAQLHQVGFKFGRWIDVGYWQRTL